MKARVRVFAALPLAGFLAAALACSPDPVLPSAPEVPTPRPKPPPGVPPTLVGLKLTPNHATLAIGYATMIRAVAVLSDGASFPVEGGWPEPQSDPPRFESADSSVLFVDPETGFAAALSAGTVEVRAVLDDTTLSGVISVDGPDDVMSNVLQIDSAFVAEYPRTYYTVGWWYYPQVFAHVPPDRRAWVEQLVIAVPGVTLDDLWQCGVWLRSPETRALNWDMWDYSAFALFSPDAQAGDASAWVVVRYVDDEGRIGVRLTSAVRRTADQISAPETPGACGS